MKMSRISQPLRKLFTFSGVDIIPELGYYYGTIKAGTWREAAILDRIL